LIAYKKDKFELIRFESFWLSATPRVPGSRYGFDQSKCPRITNAALLKLRSGGSPFWFINTHLDHQGSMARLFGAMQILQFMSERGEPSILVGDFNATPDTPEIKLLVENGEYPLTDCTAAFDGTFHGYSDRMRGKIDYIFTNLPCDVSRSVLYPDEPVNGVYLSDHRPVGAMIELD
jgi:endonuclease/exonuclease/phosphatase family metal-dependent hydrolase